MRCLGRSDSLTQRFQQDRKGSVLQLFAFSLIPMIALTGGIIDYGRAGRARTQLASTVDAAVLAAQLQYSLDKTVDYNAIITNYIAKNLTETGKFSDLKNIVVSPATISPEMEMSVHVSAEVRMPFLSLVGLDTLNIGVETAAKVGGSTLELALVLDNTGSMNGSKIGALKTSATNLVNKLLPDGDDAKIKIGVVPFADYVKLKMEDRNEPGLDIPADYSKPWTWEAHDDCDTTYPNSTQQCTDNYTSGICYNDGTPYQCDVYVNTTCTGDLGDPVKNCHWVGESSGSTEYKWFGLMGSRKHSLTTVDGSYDEQGVPGLMWNWDWSSYISPLSRLTNVKADILASLDDMRSEGYTYIPSGLVWGWRVLSNQAPFTEGVPSSDLSVRKVMVLMTDGANTRSLDVQTGDSVENHTGTPINNHGGWNVAQANQITSDLCTNVKADGIMLYTISFDVDSDQDIKTLLQACAGNGGQYFNASDEAELADAFKQIGLALLNLRLSR